MNRARLILALIVCTLFCFSCKKKAIQTSVVEDKTTDIVKLVLLDSLSASQAIIKDEKENFFDRITSLDMCIQLRRNWSEDLDREEILKDYKRQLQVEVSEFDISEKMTIAVIQDSLNVLLKKVDKKLLPPTVNLIKISGTSYGPGVFYTRDKGIYIPVDQLQTGNIDHLTGVMLHEIYHIMSRYNPDFKKSSYELIGFKPIEGEVKVDDHLAQRLLLNPDGMDMNYAVKLHMEDSSDTLNAISLIYSNEKNYLPSKGSFFGYIQFDLFTVEEKERQWQVKAKDDLEPFISDYYYQSFFAQIKDNTQYIIHPDEIMADNFMFAIFAQDSFTNFNFSPEGIELIKSIQNLIFGEVQ